MLVRFLAASALAFAALSQVSSAQSQELYALARQNSIWRIDGFDTAAPSAAFVTNWSPPAGSGSFGNGPVGLDRDPVTGDFFVLLCSWSGGSGINARLTRVDPSTGDTTTEFEIPYDGLSGLTRRWDNKFVSIHNRDTLVIIDPVDGSTTETPLASPLQGLGSVFSSFDLDARGYPQVLASASVQVDPVSGALQPAAIPSSDVFTFGAVAIANSGDVYAGTVFPGDLFRFDAANSEWIRVFDDGFSTMNNIYDFVITESNTGSGFEQVCEGTPNSTGSGATLELLGVAEVASNDLRLVTRNLPGATAGMYLMGDTAGAIPVGTGTLCISPTVYRYGATLSLVQDTYAFTADLTMLPNGQPAMANTKQIFQYWYRTNAGGTPSSNLSDAVSICFR